MRTDSIVTCSRCGLAAAGTTSVDSCRVFHDCHGCGATLRPNPRDCRVFCSFGSVRCPPVQAAGG